MPHVCLTIADIRIRLHLSDRVEKRLRGEYCSFLDSNPNADFDLEVVEVDPLDDDEPDLPTVTQKDGCLHFQSRASFAIDINRHSQQGVLRFHWRTFDAAHQRPPLCLHAALKTLYATLLTEQQGVLLHGAGLLVDNFAYAFIGPSGAGKSTLCERSATHTILNDELVAARIQNGRAILFATPFSGTHEAVRDNRSAPWQNGYLLRKGLRERVEPCSSATAFGALIPCVVLPLGSEAIEQRAFATAWQLVKLIQWQKLIFSLHLRDVRELITASTELHP